MMCGHWDWSGTVWARWKGRFRQRSAAFLQRTLLSTPPIHPCLRCGSTFHFWYINVRLFIAFPHPSTWPVGHRSHSSCGTGLLYTHCPLLPRFIINCPFCLSNPCLALLLISFPLIFNFHLLLEPHLNKMSWEFCYSVYRTGHVQALTRSAYPSSSLSPPFSWSSFLHWELHASNPSIKDISASLLGPIRGCDIAQVLYITSSLAWALH